MGLVVVAFIFVWGVFVWKERTLFSTPKFFLRILIATVALLALALIALKPISPIKYTPVAGVVLTSGYETKTLDSLKKQHVDLKVLTYMDKTDITDSLSLFDPLYILGQGVAPFNFWQFQNLSPTYLGGTVPSGIIRLNFGREGVEGSKFMVRGMYNRPKFGHSLILMDPGGSGQDSIVLGNQNQQEFALIPNLKVQGQLLYSLVEKDSVGAVVRKDPLPLVIKEKKKLRIAILNGFPTFETKYLKNFLAEAGHELVVRSQMTKGKFKFEYFNTKKAGHGLLSKDKLLGFDLLIMDTNTYLGLSKTEKDALGEVVRENGLGIFVQSNEALFKSAKGLMDFNFIADGIEEREWAKDSKLILDTYPYHIQDEMGIRQIHQSNDRFLTGYGRLGKGRIGTTVVRATFPLVLEGHVENYRQFWTSVINTIGKRNIPEADWKLEDFPVLLDRPLNFSIRTTKTDFEVVSTEKVHIALKRYVDVKDLWYGTTYPRKTGWNGLQLKTDTTHRHLFYVMDTLSWKSLQGYDLLQENRRFFQPKEEAEEAPTTYKPINPLWFYCIFLLGMGYLWLVPKLKKED